MAAKFKAASDVYTAPGAFISADIANLQAGLAQMQSMTQGSGGSTPTNLLAVRSYLSVAGLGG